VLEVVRLSETAIAYWALIKKLDGMEICQATGMRCIWSAHSTKIEEAATDIDTVLLRLVTQARSDAILRLISTLFQCHSNPRLTGRLWMQVPSTCSIPHARTI
jgi:hypothetical protein